MERSLSPRIVPASVRVTNRPLTIALSPSFGFALACTFARTMDTLACVQLGSKMRCRRGVRAADVLPPGGGELGADQGLDRHLDAGDDGGHLLTRHRLAVGD